MINVRTLRKLANNDGMTLMYGMIISSHTGQQVVDYGVKCCSPESAMRAIRVVRRYCNVWLKDGVYYVGGGFPC